MSEQGQERLYNLYCDYIERVNVGVSDQRFRVPALKSVTYPNFLAIWNATSEQHRRWWHQRFETGYKVVAEALHQTFVEAFTENAMPAKSVRSDRAA